MELELRHISKRYGKKTAVQDVSLTLTPGVWGLIGANGAGKTTLMRILTGILTPSEGQVRYDGIDTARLGEAYGISSPELRLLPGIYGARLSGIYGNAEGASPARLSGKD